MFAPKQLSDAITVAKYIRSRYMPLRAYPGSERLLHAAHQEC